jgi:hypothetical protein
MKVCDALRKQAFLVALKCGAIGISAIWLAQKLSLDISLLFATCLGVVLGWVTAWLYRAFRPQSDEAKIDRQQPEGSQRRSLDQSIRRPK